MPRVRKYRRKPVNYLRAYMDAQRRAAGLTSSDIADEIGVTDSAVRNQLRKPAEKWTVEQLVTYCNIIGCSTPDAFAEAIRK